MNLSESISAINQFQYTYRIIGGTLEALEEMRTHYNELNAYEKQAFDSFMSQAKDFFMESDNAQSFG